MENSILNDVKRLLGLVEEDTNFDADIIIHINTAFTILTQLGVGPTDGFYISDKSAQWKDFLSDNNKFNSVITYVYLKVRMVFDPPQTSFLIESINRNIEQLEWRLVAQAEGATL
jgi:hypothetical protein